MILKKNDWLEVEFLASAVKPPFPLLKDDQGRQLPEVAVAGRSNVGKSTLLNDLFGPKKNLVKTSSTPGKTQLLNFFSVKKVLCFVDLPGYGYAKVPLEVREQWGPMIQGYLSEREQLKLLLFLFDIRRMPQEEDIELMEWIAKAGKGVILVLTKIDKLKTNEIKSQTQKILSGFGVENLQYLHYSAPKNVGREGLIRMLNEALGEET